MSSTAGEKVRPVDPKRLHLALDIYQTAIAADRANVQASEASSNSDEKGAPAIGIQLASAAAQRAMLAVQKEFPEAEEFQSLSLRLDRFFDLLGDRKLIKWGMVQHRDTGVEIHDAVIQALALAPFRKSGVLNRDAFHALVKLEYEKLEAEENK
jgi:hypothetical protein